MSSMEYIELLSNNLALNSYQCPRRTCCAGAKQTLKGLVLVVSLCFEHSRVALRKGKPAVCKDLLEKTARIGAHGKPCVPVRNLAEAGKGKEAANCWCERTGTTACCKAA